MDHTNSCLVGYKLIAANGIAPVYDKGFLGQEAMWADPDIAQAATWMRRLVDDRHFREKIGGKATEDLVLYQREANRGRFIEEIGALWEATRFMPSLAAERERKLQLLRDSVPVDRVNYLQRAVNEIRRQLDRHILWRFNAQNSDQSL
jgi:hypothetical protein